MADNETKRSYTQLDSKTQVNEAIAIAITKGRKDLFLGI